MQKISKNENISNFDPNQIHGLTFDYLRDAVRVYMVDGPSGNNNESTSTSGQVIKVPEIIRETEVHQVNVPVIVKEIERFEVPVIIKEIEYKIIEVPVVVREVQVVEIEKPVVIKETEFKYIEKIVPVIPSYVSICMLIQTAAIVGLLLTSFLKGR